MAKQHKVSKIYKAKLDCIFVRPGSGKTP